ncbi:MAG: ABC transporter substrate-binding protein [Burkholderiaceae bacterium]
MRRRAFARCLFGIAAAPALVRATPQQLRIGLILPRTGPLAVMGQACLRGAELAPDLLRERLGVDVELMTADSASDPVRASALAARLADEGAHVLVGPFDSRSAAAIVPVVEQRRIPFVINTAAAPELTAPGQRFVFRNFPTSRELVRGALARLGEVLQMGPGAAPSPRPAVVFHLDDEFGRAYREAIDAELAASGDPPVKILETFAYARQPRDLPARVRHAKALAPDVALLVCRLNDAIVLVREMVHQGWMPPTLLGPGSPGLYEAQFIRALGAHARHALSAVPWLDPTSPLTEAIERADAARRPREPLVFQSINVGATFEAILVAADAFARVPTADGLALATAIRAGRIAERAMAGGPIRFDDSGHCGAHESVCLQNLGGRPRVVLPARLAQAEPVLSARRAEAPA